MSEPDNGSTVGYHVRYEPANDPGRHYWTHVTSNREAAMEALRFWRERDVNAQLYTRTCTPWEVVEDV